MNKIAPDLTKNMSEDKRPSDQSIKSGTQELKPPKASILKRNAMKNNEINVERLTTIVRGMTTKKLKKKESKGTDLTKRFYSSLRNKVLL